MLKTISKVIVVTTLILSSASLSAMQKSVGRGSTSATVSVGPESASVGVSRSGRVGGSASVSGNYNGSASGSVGVSANSKSSSVGITGTVGSWGGRYITISASKRFRRAIARDMILEELGLLND